MTTETPAADVVERLRDLKELSQEIQQNHRALRERVADEIARLHAENAELESRAWEQAKIALIEKNRADELQRKLDEAVNMLVRWQSWSCGQRGGSPFFDSRDLLTSIRGVG